MGDRRSNSSAIRLCYPDSVNFESLVYPPYDAPLAEAYGGRFESVYIVLHPFVAVPDSLAWNATEQYPSHEEILSHGTKFPWAQVAAETGLHTCAKLNQALLTSIGAVSEELRDDPARDALQRYLESGSVWMPIEGCFETLLQADFLHAFEAAGQEELIFVPEFPNADPVQRLNVSRVRNGQESFPERGTLAAPDASFLLTVDWDSFFTLFYGPREFVAEVARRRRLEGFFATPTTEHQWFNYSLGCCVVTLAPEDFSAR
jgi:hypothetical protein